MTWLRAEHGVRFTHEIIIRFGPGEADDGHLFDDKIADGAFHADDGAVSPGQLEQALLVDGLNVTAGQGGNGRPFESGDELFLP